MPSDNQQVGSIKTWTPAPGMQPYYVPPATQWISNVPSADYANEVEIEERDHDAVLTFWRNGPKSTRQRTAQITVPLSLLKEIRG